MPEWVRVKDKSTGHKLTVVASAAEDQDAYQILKQDAVDNHGDPLPPEFAEAGQPAATPKEKS